MPLAEAITEDDAALVRNELRGGADPNVQGRYGVTLPQFAVYCGSEESLEVLLKSGANPNLPGEGADTVVHTAAKASEPVYLRRLLDNGGDPDARNTTTGATPLIRAILFPGDTDERFQMLLDAGADVNAEDRNGNIPLHVAGRVNAGGKILKMLELGADPRKRNSQGATFQEYYFGYDEEILDESAKRERKLVRAWLLENGVPVWNPPLAG